MAGGTPPTDSTRVFTERDMVPVHPGGRPPMRVDSVAVGTFPIDSFPCSEEMPAINQRGKGASLEGYIGMQASMNAPNTLPASMMLPSDVTNLLVPVAVRASHVAFSSVRLEPTWMSLGDAVRSCCCCHMCMLAGVRLSRSRSLSLSLSPPLSLPPSLSLLLGLCLPFSCKHV